MFTLHEKLEQDSFPITRLELGELRLMNNAYYKWLLLIPMQENARDLIDLLWEQQILCLKEINLAANCLKDLFSPDKLNIASLGNQISQLHIHIIARNIGDDDWPNPVWGGKSRRYNGEEVKLIQKIKGYIND